MKKEKSANIKTYILLHLIILGYSVSALLSKTASGQVFISTNFILCYGGAVFLLVVYALMWQQILKRLPLSVAYANKAISLLWGLIFGMLFFHESITVGKIIGIALVCGGILLVVNNNE